MSANMPSFTVDRKQWGRGNNKHLNLLLNSKDKKMCCLGFACEQLGKVPREKLKNIATPEEVYDLFEKDERKADDFEKAMGFLFKKIEYAEDIRVFNTDLCSLAMNINDNPDLKDPDREIMLVFLFRSQGIRINFIN